MAHKRPKWNKCFTHGVIQKWPNAKLLTPESSVHVGMTVSAEYGENIVVLKITAIRQDNDFEAKIDSFEPINIALPKDLKEREIVLINREDICCIHPKDK